MQTTYGNGVITCSVPQGSILGALLFLICVNDMDIRHCAADMYADDTSFHINDKSIAVLDQNKELVFQQGAVLPAP